METNRTIFDAIMTAFLVVVGVLFCLCLGALLFVIAAAHSPLMGLIFGGLVAIPSSVFCLFAGIDCMRG